MRKNWWSFIALIPFLAVAQCASKSDAVADNKKVKYEYEESGNSLLWEISGNGLKEPSYLYGTIHLQEKKVFQYDDKVKEIFMSTEAYAMELNMDEMNLMEVANMMKMDKPLDEVIGEKRYRAIDSMLVMRTGEGVGIMKMMKPFFIYAKLIEGVSKKEMPLALDLDFASMAKKNKKKVIGIEKIEEQLGAIDKMTIEEQVHFLEEGLKEWEKSEALFANMMRLYLTQNIDSLVILTKDTTMPASFDKALLVDRNKVMADRIEKIIKEQPTFNAVGAAHLGGKDGVIALLRKKGYTVKPVKVRFKK